MPRPVGNGAGWGGPAKGAGKGGEAKPFTAEDSERNRMLWANAPRDAEGHVLASAKREIKRRRVEALEDKLLAIALGEEQGTPVQVTAGARLHAIYEGMPVTRGSLQHTGAEGGPMQIVTTYQLPDNGRDNAGDPATEGTAGEIPS